MTAPPRRARIAAAAPLLGLLTLAAVITVVVYVAPEALFVTAAVALTACAALILAATIARRTPPRTTVPDRSRIERWIDRAARSPTPQAVRELLGRLGQWPHVLDRLPSRSRARVRSLVRRVDLVATLDEWARDGRPRGRRIGALHLIGWLDLPGAEDRLIGLMSDADVDLAYEAASALLRLDTERGYEAILGRIGGGGIPDSRLAALLEEATPTRLASVLERHGDDRNASRRFWVAHLGGRVGGPGVLPLLLRLSDDADLDVRANAAEALGAMDHEAARSRLHELLRDPSWVVQSHAARALGELGASRSVAPLMLLLESPHWWVRENAVRALEEGGTAVIPELRRFLHGLRDGARRAAVDVLLRLGFVEWAATAIRSGSLARTELDRDLRLIQAVGAEATLTRSLEAAGAAAGGPGS